MSDTDWTFEQTLRHDNPIVRDHHVHDVRTLPGVTLLDMVYRLAPSCVGKLPFELRRVVFKQPIVTSEDFDCLVRVHFEPLETHWRVTVRSARLARVQASAAPFTINMDCALVLVAPPSAASANAQRLDVAGFVRSAAYQVDMEEIYGISGRARIRHLNFMRTRGTVYARGDEELMHIRLSDEAEAARAHFLAHPALLDGSTFAGQSARLRNRVLAEDDTPYIPFTIDRFRLYGSLPREVYTHTNNGELLRHASGALPDVCAADIVVHDADGQVLARFERLSMKRIRSSALIRELVQVGPIAAALPGRAASAPAAAGAAMDAPGTVRDFIAARVAQALGKTSDALDTAENFYDLGMDSTLLLQLTKELETAIGQELYPTLLFEHSSIDKLSGYLESTYGPALAAAHAAPGAQPHAVATEEAPAPALQLWQPLAQGWARSEEQAAGADLPRYVAWVSEAHSTEWDGRLRPLLEGTPEVREVVMLRPGGTDWALWSEDLLLQLIEHAKRLAARRDAGDVVLQVLVGVSEGARWARAVADGCLKTLALEYPRIRCQTVSFDDLAARLPADVAQLLHAHGRCAARGAVRLDHAAGAAVPQAQQWQAVAMPDAAASAFRHGGVYVIAGGLGGLAVHVARHLMAHHAARVALLGRSAPDARSREVLRALEALGGEVSYHAADLCDAAALEAAFAEVRRRHGVIHGVIHSAGRVQDQVVARKDLRDARRVIAPKTQGLWNLDHVTRNDALDVFAIFSSLSALTGNVGQIDYGAANAFEDEFSRHRQALVAARRRHGRTLSINWPLWADGGMAIGGDGHRKLYESTGLRPMPATEGLRALESALSLGVPQVAVTYGQGDTIAAYLRSRQLVAVETAPAPAAGAHPQGRGTPRAVGRSGAIAIIGMAGRYPLARNLDEYRRNLREGRDCIGSLPVERWAGHHFGYDIESVYRFGGFLDQIDCFDPQFFGIPPVRAQALDPQARLFLETAWHACEDAGFAVDRSHSHYAHASQRSVGVFVGAFWSHYELFAAQSSVHGVPASMGVSLSSISNMTSYCLNLHGPSVAVDTMCSSALTAIHLACESLRRDECQFAIAGGVNLVAHPHKFIFLRENHFLSSHGNCRSYGEGGDGYVPGEGVGAMLLTPLERAQDLGLPVHAVIRGSAINHSGRTAGGTVPNPVAQAEVIADALRAAAVDPRTIGYVEGHGTGTALGDPIEVEGLTRAFGGWTRERQFCALGSSKSAIGHLEAAAGVAGLTKLVMQFEDEAMYPSLHAQRLNPHIPFADTPFVVQAQARAWPRDVGAASPRRALISSFGASGSNASLVLEAYDEPAIGQAPARAAAGPQAIVLSARDAHALVRVADRLLGALRSGTYGEGDLEAVAFTLQAGREAMAERAACVVGSWSELDRALETLRSGDAAAAGWLRGRKGRAPGPKPDSACPASADPGALDALLQAWVGGAEVEWRRLHPQRAPGFVRLPGYPFARQRCWFGERPEPAAAPQGEVPVAAVTPTAREPGRLKAPPAAADRRPAQQANPEAPASGATGAAPRLRLAPAPAVGAARSRPRPAARQRVSLAALARAPAPTLVSEPRAEALPAPSLETARSTLVASLAHLLFCKPEDIDPALPFPELGLDSVIAVQWMRQVNQDFGTDMKATVLYEHPSVDQLAARLAAAGAEAPPAPAAEDAMPSQVTPEPRLPDVTRQEVLGFLKASLAGVLFVAEDDLDADATFIDLGLDSIIAVQWVRAINARFALDFKAGALYEHRTLNALASHLAALSGGRPGVAAAAPGAMAAPPPEVDAVPAAVRAAPPETPAAEVVKEHLKQSLAAVLFIEPEEIGDDVLFTEYGLDSIIAVQWVKAVNARHGTAIKATALYQHPTIEALARHVSASLAAPGALDDAAPAAAAAALARRTDAAARVFDTGPGSALEVFEFGQGLPLLLLPPMGTLARSWWKQVEVFASERRVVVVHHAGHGRSTMPVPQIGFDAMADAVASVLTQLGIRQPADVVGWSMGALLAQRLAARWPAVVHSLTLVAAPAHGVSGDTSDAAMEVLSSMPRDFAQNLPAEVEGEPESDYDFIKSTVSLDVALAWLEATLAFDHAGAAAIGVPTLVVHGARDQVIAAEHGAKLAALIPGARLAQHPSAGHYVPLHHPAWFNEQLGRFLAGTADHAAPPPAPAAAPGGDEAPALPTCGVP